MISAEQAPGVAAGVAAAHPGGLAAAMLERVAQRRGLPEPSVSDHEERACGQSGTDPPPKLGAVEHRRRASHDVGHRLTLSAVGGRGKRRHVR